MPLTGVRISAIAVARKLGLSEDLIIESLAAAEGPEMRLQFRSPSPRPMA